MVAIALLLSMENLTYVTTIKHRKTIAIVAWMLQTCSCIFLKVQNVTTWSDFQNQAYAFIYYQGHSQEFLKGVSIGSRSQMHGSGGPRCWWIMNYHVTQWYYNRSCLYSCWATISSICMITVIAALCKINLAKTYLKNGKDFLLVLF